MQPCWAEERWFCELVFSFDCIHLFCIYFTDYGSQDFYDVPRPFPPDKSCSFDFNESLNNYLVSFPNESTWSILKLGPVFQMS